jgi:hypothetical protein
VTTDLQTDRGDSEIER